VIISFLEDIMSRFGCKHRIVTDNATSFKAKTLINFYDQYGITLVHSTPYYPQGNGLLESSNKSLINIIKKLLEENKKAWDSKLKFPLWANRVTTKRSLGISPFQLVYGVEAIFLSQLAFPVEKLFQDYQGEPDDMIRKILQLVEVQQTREKLLDKAHDHRQKIKRAFDKKTRKGYFQQRDLVLKWDAPKQDKGKNGKFEALWICPFNIFEVFLKNTYKLQNLEDFEFLGGPVCWHRGKPRVQRCNNAPTKP
jgi:hypothetical protein